jgi:hypothetical protein
VCCHNKTLSFPTPIGNPEFPPCHSGLDPESRIPPLCHSKLDLESRGGVGQGKCRRGACLPAHRRRGDKPTCLSRHGRHIGRPLRRADALPCHSRPDRESLPDSTPHTRNLLIHAPNSAKFDASVFNRQGIKSQRLYTAPNSFKNPGCLPRKKDTWDIGKGK